ncbi:MAG: hypothetical protein E7302_08155 [Butyrivibrio sp.]|nr:hypothetical protein [Butyrivibrio sp.]
MLTLDFTGIYENEEFDFYKETTPRSLFVSKYISLKDISGTNCICDDFAIEEIKKRIRKGLMNTPGAGSDEEEKGAYSENPRISVFDNGNYHYMSRILMEILVEDMKEESSFDLIVFDHHPDMKWTSYGDVLSCGCWVLSALKDIRGLKYVYIIGADKKLMKEAYADTPETIDRVHYFEDFSLFKKSIDSGETNIAEKIYISVDKDVVSKDELLTNWDQGDMSIDELINALDYFEEKYHDKILAVDVCGECAPDSEDGYLPNGFSKSNRLNDNIISIFLKTL